MGGIGGIVDRIKNTVQQVAQTVQRAAAEIGSKVKEITNPAVDAHRGHDGFDRPSPVVESRDRPGGPMVQGPGGPTVA